MAYDTVFWYRFPLLKKAHARSEFHEEEGYEKFYMESWYWLNDYAFYMALKFHFDNQEWLAWPEDIRFRKKDAVERYKEELKEEIDFWKFLQYKFFQQWKKLRAYANSQGISIIGDIPIYVALDSADVWTRATRELFLLDEENLTPLKVAGVPPDAFSEDGTALGKSPVPLGCTGENGFCLVEGADQGVGTAVRCGPHRSFHRRGPWTVRSGGS